jgi:pimeloyl-ACP methyl ester carboxylesterase
MTEKIRRGFIDMEWGQVHYRTMGSGMPLILTHKTYFSSRTMQRVMPLLAKHFRVICPDTPGQGDSDNPPEQWSIPQYTEAFLAVLSALEVDNFYLIGNSTGASIACEAAVIAPERIEKLILFGMPRWKDEEARQALRKSPLFYGPLEVMEDGSHLKVIWDRLYPRWKGFPYECFEIDFFEALSRKPRTYEGIEAVLNYNETARLPLLQMPTLLMWATEDTMFTPFIEDTANLVPHAVTKVLESSAKMYLRDPEEYVKTVLEFLQ